MKLDKELLEIYDQELLFIRKTAKKLAKEDNHLDNQINGNLSNDSYSRNLTDGAVLLNARIKRKMTQDLENLNHILLNIFNPTYLKPIPSLAIVNVIPEKNLTQKKVIQKNDLLEIDYKPNKKICFSTCYKTEILPLETTTKFIFNTNNFLLTLSMTAEKEVNLSGITNLKLHINLPLASADLLIATLLNSTESIKITVNHHTNFVLNSSCLKIAGLKSEENLLFIQSKDFDPTQLISEFLVFPQKFLFLELTNLEKIFTENVARNTRQIDICFILKNSCNLKKIEEIIKPDSLLINCMPVINLFTHSAKPFRLTQTKSSYQVEPDGFNLGLHSIKKVYSIDNKNNHRGYAPLFSKEKHSNFYFFDHNQKLSFYYENYKNITFGKEIINASLICYNTELNEHTLTVDKLARAKLVNNTNIKQIIFLTIPTKTIVQKNDIAIEQLIYNEFKRHRGLLSSENQNFNLLKNIIKSAADCVGIDCHQWLTGLIELQSKPLSIKNQFNQHITNFYQGTNFILKVDTACFNNMSLYLFVSILNKVLSQSCDINSFIQLNLIDQNNTTLYSWLPCSGDEML